MPPGRTRSPHNRLSTSNKLGLPSEPSRRLREHQAQQKEVLQEAQRIKQTIQHRNVCLECDGTGRLIVGPKKNLTRPCDKCRGTGTVQLWPLTIWEALRQKVQAQESRRTTMNALIQAMASDPVQMMASMPTFMGQLPAKSQPAIQQIPTYHPATLPKTPEKPKKEAPKREGTWWEVPEEPKKPEEPKNLGMGIAEQIARDHMFEWDSLSGVMPTLMNPTPIQPVALSGGMRFIDEIEIEVNPFDPNEPLIGDQIELINQLTGDRAMTTITRIVESPQGQSDIMHLILSPPVAIEINQNTRVHWHRVNRAKTALPLPPRLLRLARSFLVKEAQEIVERAFKKHMQQFLGSPTKATTLRDVQNLADRILHQLKSTNQVPAAIESVDVRQDPLEPGKINITVMWNATDPMVSRVPPNALVNILAKELNEQLPAGVEAVLSLEEVEPEGKPREEKHPLEREQSFWKLPKS